MTRNGSAARAGAADVRDVVEGSRLAELLRKLDAGPSAEPGTDVPAETRAAFRDLRIRAARAFLRTATRLVEGERREVAR